MIKLAEFQDYVINQYAPADEGLPAALRMEADGSLAAYYAPFDHINRNARVVICGITPGISQATIALTEAQRALRSGASLEEADRQAKNTASFAGAMRSNLVAMLDALEVPGLLGISSCAELFGSRRELVHYTSALRYPVLKDGANYSGSPSMVSNPFLRRQLDQYLADELASLGRDTLLIPLGPKVEEALTYVAKHSAVSENQILSGIPHPSGANAERIAYFLGRKEREQLSHKTNPDRIDDGKRQATAVIEGLKKRAAA